VKRFYRRVEPVGDGEFWRVTLDGKPIRTPGKAALRLPTRALADAIAAEWAAQAETIRPETMKLTRLANTAIDRVAGAIDLVAGEILKYADTDLLCHRAEEPPDLAARQAALWQPLLDWASLRFDAPLNVGFGILPLAQPEDSVRALGNALAVLDGFALTAIADLAGSCGSVVLALAVFEGRIDAEQAGAAAQLDEIYQAERWGEDAEAAERRRRVGAEIAAAARFARALAG
jgi:chaperone required for assembly of F1-ATPase